MKSSFAVVAALGALINYSEAILTSEDIYWMQYDAMQGDNPDQYRDYFYNPNHKKMDYAAYDDAMRRGLPVS